MKYLLLLNLPVILVAIIFALLFAVSAVLKAAGMA